MNLLAPVSTIMSTDLITISECENMHKVGEIFRKRNIHHLPVIDEGELVGMISKSDYLPFQHAAEQSDVKQSYHNKRLKSIPVSHVMTRGLATLHPDDRINIALEVFKENLFHAIPIVENKRLRGIITTFDIIEQLAKSGSAVSKYEKI